MFTAFKLQVLAMAVVWMLRAGWIVGTLPIVVAPRIAVVHKLLLWLGGLGKIVKSPSKVSRFI